MSDLIFTCIKTFFLGALVDYMAARWVVAVAKGSAMSSALISMVCTVSILMGFGEALHYGWPAVTWVLGYGFGSYAAVKWTKKQPTTSV